MGDFIEVEYAGFRATVAVDPAGKLQVYTCSNPSIVGSDNPLRVAMEYCLFLMHVQHACASLLGPGNLPDVRRYKRQ